MPLAAVLSKPQKPELAAILPALRTWLDERGWSVLLDVESAAYLPGLGAGVARGELASRGPELAIVLGGDGTLLAAARAFAATGIPLLSVNLGSLGFLTETPLAELYATLSAFLDGTAQVERRSLVRAELRRADGRSRCWDALNDVVVAKGSIARIADFAVAIDGMAVAEIRADGLILSTPTGSTAYNLAAGGPIVMPSVTAMLITPICPHLLTIRPIVVPGEATIRVRLTGAPSETYLTVDGQEAVPMHAGDEIQCCRSPYSVSLLRMKSSGLFNVLRSKLKWGVR